MYVVQEQGKPNAKTRTLHRNNLMSCHNFPVENIEMAKAQKPHDIKNQVSEDEVFEESSDDELELIENLRSLKSKGSNEKWRRLTEMVSNNDEKNKDETICSRK